jgi:hypothetical protein
VSTLLGLVLTPAFIRGWFGLPQFAVASAAAASTLATLMGLAGLLVVQAARKDPLAFDRAMLRELRIRPAILTALLRIVLPRRLAQTRSRTARRLDLDGSFVAPQAPGPAGLGRGCRMRQNAGDDLGDQRFRARRGIGRAIFFKPGPGFRGALRGRGVAAGTSRRFHAPQRVDEHRHRRCGKIRLSGAACDIGCDPPDRVVDVAVAVRHELGPQP